MVLLSHPTGNAFIRAGLVSLMEAGHLGEFHTTVASYPGNVWDVLGKSRFGRELNRRKFDERLKSLTVQHPFRELGRMAASRLNLHWLCRHETGVFCTDAVFRSQDRLVAEHLRKSRRPFTAVYAMEDGALETFRVAKAAGMRCCYDLPIAYWRKAQKLLQEETQRLPAWKHTMSGVQDSSAKLERKTEELHLADVVICPSKFVAESLPQEAQANKQVAIAPFGSPPPAEEFSLRSKVNGKLRVLFAGSMSQRKGLGDLFAAMKQLRRRDVELVVMGSPQASMEFYRREFNELVFEPGRPHNQVLELMRTCDVFCLPSIVEGRALVMQEAMSQGLPLIITPNTGGEDLIKEGITGFLVPIRNPDQIARKIEWFADHRNAIPEMSQAARSHAHQLTWEYYGQAIVDAVHPQSLLKNGSHRD
jgi:glycosyltransferase involved in cell wall biosynthesis